MRRISKLWVTVAEIWPPPRWLWWVSTTPHLQIAGQGLSSPGAPWVPPGPPEDYPVNWPKSSSPNAPPEPRSDAPTRPPISLPLIRFQPHAEPWKTDVRNIRYSASWPGISYTYYDADDESNDSSDWGGTEIKLPVSLNQTEFSMKQFAKRMGQANYSGCNKWKKVWVAGFQEKKYRYNMREQNRLKQVRDGHLHWAMEVTDVSERFENCLPLGNFDNAEWIQ